MTVGCKAAYNMSRHWACGCCEFRRHCLCSSHIQYRYNAQHDIDISHTQKSFLATNTHKQKYKQQRFNAITWWTCVSWHLQLRNGTILLEQSFNINTDHLMMTIAIRLQRC